MLAPSLPHVSPRAGRRCRMRAAALLTRSPRPGRSSHQTQASQALFPDTPGANAVLRRPGCGLTGPAGARRALHAAKRTVHRAGCQAPSSRGDAERGTAAGARRWRMAWPGRAGAEPGAPAATGPGRGPPSAGPPQEGPGPGEPAPDLPGVAWAQGASGVTGRLGGRPVTATAAATALARTCPEAGAAGRPVALAAADRPVPCPVTAGPRERRPGR